jgi:hypothetical protein
LRAASIQVGNAVDAGLAITFGVVRVEEDVELRLVQVAVVLDAGGFLDAVGVIQQHAEVADAAHAGFRAHRGLAGFDARVAEDALLGLAALPVVVDLLVGAAETHMRQPRHLSWSISTMPSSSRL